MSGTDAGNRAIGENNQKSREQAMGSFVPEYFILLGLEELESLVSAGNRDEYQPDLKAYLYAAGNLRMLRRLSLPPGGHEWRPPSFNIAGDGAIVDADGLIRGHLRAMRMPARPGELQMALSHDWFWSLFRDELIRNGAWAWLEDRELMMIAPKDHPVSVDAVWAGLWKYLASTEHLMRSLDIFLDNKTLFKSQAKPWDSNDIPILSPEMARYLIRYYQRGASRKKHFKQASIPKAIADLENVLEKGKYETIPMEQPVPVDYVKGGDFYLGEKYERCLGCGDIILKKKGLKRLAVFLKDADERPQSGREKDDKNIFCKRCIGAVFLCPVKLTRETLTVRFHMPMAKGDRARRQGTAEMELKKFVAQSLHVHAGNFISLHITEMAKQQPLARAWGHYHYSLWKMAVIFPPELFAQGFAVSVFPGEEQFELPRWAVWFVSSLAEWDNVFDYRCYSNDGYRPHMGQFLRLVTRKRIFQAFYVLLSGGLIHGGYAHTWRINRLQEIWKELENRLNEEEDMPIPDYPKIAGFTGLLLPLAERVQSCKKDPNERKRAVGKLLEEADRPVQYAYTAARETGASEFIFCKTARNRYFYEKAVELLEWAGEDVALLKSEGERIVNEREAFDWARKADEKIFIGPSQISRATSALVSENEKPYESEADWRAFAYQVKLALWSMFPQHLGSQDKQGKE